MFELPASMELINNSTTTLAKSPDPESEPETPSKPSPLKHHQHHHPVVVSYNECLKNHAATIGGHALDGCREFMPVSPAPTNPSDLKCAACGCHRNFHRREDQETVGLSPRKTHRNYPEVMKRRVAWQPAQPKVIKRRVLEQPAAQLAESELRALEYKPHHRYHPPSPDNSLSPPPISSVYHPSALALSHGALGRHANSTPTAAAKGHSNNKRFRTKFTQLQKEKMLELAKRVGWKMQKRDEDLINGFCRGIGVDRDVFKVWMHNNKNTFGRRDNNVMINPPLATANGNYGDNHKDEEEDVHRQETMSHVHDNLGEDRSTAHHVLGNSGSCSS